MSQFNGMTLTDKGLALQSAVQSGLALHFTRVALGDGTLADGADLRTLTAMTHSVLELPIVSVTPSSTGTAKLEVVLRNTGLAEGFFARELAVFAQDTNGNEILYSYAYAGLNSDYIPAGGGADVVEYILTIYMVIGRATNVTAVIDTGLAFVTQGQLNDHRDSPNPHTYLPSLGVTATDISHLWVQQSGSGKLQPISFSAAKQLILGGDGTDLVSLSSRLGQTEREMDNIALELLANGTYPSFNARIAEDFKAPDLVDMFQCAITSIAAGDDSVDVETLQGIIPGAWYTISDGVYQETCQIKSIIKNGTTLRLMMASPVQNPYLSGSTNLYRTTAQIQTSDGEAVGSGDRRTALWQPTTAAWTGTNANATVTVPLVTTAANASAFVSTSGIGYTANGCVTLV